MATILTLPSLYRAAVSTPRPTPVQDLNCTGPLKCPTSTFIELESRQHYASKGSAAAWSRAGGATADRYLLVDSESSFFEFASSRVRRCSQSSHLATCLAKIQQRIRALPNRPANSQHQSAVKIEASPTQADRHGHSDTASLPPGAPALPSRSPLLFLPCRFALLRYSSLTSLRLCAPPQSPRYLPALLPSSRRSSHPLHAADVRCHAWLKCHGGGGAGERDEGPVEREEDMRRVLDRQEERSDLRCLLQGPEAQAGEFIR